MAKRVQVRVFAATVESCDIKTVDAMVASLWSEVNAFLATIPAGDVLDVQGECDNLPCKYGTVSHTHYHIHVLYLIQQEG